MAAPPLILDKTPLCLLDRLESFSHMPFGNSYKAKKSASQLSSQLITILLAVKYNIVE